MEVFFTSPGHWCLHRERSIMGETRFFNGLYVPAWTNLSRVKPWLGSLLLILNFFLYLFLCGEWGEGDGEWIF